MGAKQEDGKELECSGVAMDSEKEAKENEEKCTEMEEEEEEGEEAKKEGQTVGRSAMQVRSIQVDQAELVRLLRDEALALPDLDIAISGLAGRFPKSESLNEFEEHLRQGRDMINDNDSARFTCGLWNLPPRAGRLKDLSSFDHEFFGFSHEHANYIDYQLRIMYEVVYESILDAGLNPANLRGSNTGLFFGLHCNEFENAMADDPKFKTSGYYAQFAIKLAQYFDFRGLTLTFDAACASGFVALHNGVEALRQGIVEQAIVCSSNIPIHPTGSFIFYQMQMLSPTGYSRFLDSRADGYVKSEASVSLVLQRKQLAKRNWASLMATMTSVDGYKPEGITFPSDSSQERLIRATKELAGVSVNHVEYLEAHGTGTPAGDPQEARAISNVYCLAEEAPAGGEQRRIGPLLVGSVKTCMGHSEAASGLCALAKVAMMLEHELIYKNLHFDQPNQNIEALMDGRIKFVDQQERLKSKIVPLSCYGFGGSNVHAIVRANEREQIGHDQQRQTLDTAGLPRLVVMFGRQPAQLGEFFDQFTRADTYHTRHCYSDDFIALLDSISSAKIDRLWNYRGFLLLDVQNGGKEMARGIERCDLKPMREAEGGETEDLGRRIHHQECQPRPVHLLLPGLGCQWAGMASGLRQLRPFWATIERLAAHLEVFGLDLVGLVERAEAQLEEGPLAHAFVAIVAYQVALINVLKHQLRPNNLGSIVGHSLGEVSCAYAAGVFDERETILVAYRLAEALDANSALIEGKMVALVGLASEQIERLVDQYRVAGGPQQSLRVSCINGPNSVTISGLAQHVDAFLAWLDSERAALAAQLLVHEVSGRVALHNELLMGQPAVKLALRRALERVLTPLTDYDRTGTKWISSVPLEVGASANANERDDRWHAQAHIDYFVEMLCRPVGLAAALNELEGESIVYEGAPANLFESQIVQMHEPTGGRKFHYVRTMCKLTAHDQQLASLLASFGRLYLAGATFDLAHFYQLAAGGGAREFPVRRQTPSLSSLIRWDHSSTLFVPRYPMQFSKSSAKCEMPIDMVEERDKYLADHCIEGRVLHPATGYLFLIWRIFSFTKRKIYDACFQDVENELVSIEFRSVRLLRAVILAQRQVQMYIHYEEATGRFEVKEGGSVVCDGYAHSPQENPGGLLYESVRERLEAEELELTLDKDDVYKQFRVSGYDYGPNFQGVQAASADGRRCRVRSNGHFVCLTDSILQSIFLAIAQYAPPGSLFLPTRLDYVRFQPQTILAKLRAAKVPFDVSDGSLNTKAKREMMSKIMERSSGGQSKPTAPADKHEEQEQEAAGQQQQTEQQTAECIFETFCDPQLNIIVTDGIEMRGIKASPAPRRSDANEVLLESYQFVRDHEQPVEDEHLTRFQAVTRKYSEVCDSMALELLMRLFSMQSSDQLNGLIKAQGGALLARAQVDSYLREHLESLACTGAEPAGKPAGDGEEGEASDAAPYDIKRNGPRTLMSLYDQLLAQAGGAFERLRASVHANRLHLMRDLLQQTYVSERYMRPMLETVLENVCQRRLKLSVAEINTDDGVLRPSLQALLQQLEPALQLDYALAHPDPSRLHGSALAGQPAAAKTHKLRDVEALFQDSQLKNLDFIVYKDSSCYGQLAAPTGPVERAKLAAMLRALAQATRPAGYFMLLMRKQLTLAERTLAALVQGRQAGRPPARQVLDTIHAINGHLNEHYQMLLEEASELARKLAVCLVSKKCDPNGCTMLLFRRLANPGESAGAGAPVERLVLRVRHDDLGWLEMLKRNFHPQQTDDASSTSQTSSIGLSSEEDKSSAASDSQASQSADKPADEAAAPRQVWLCAVLTRQCHLNGTIGMMQALRKELGSSHLRCFYDAHTFRHHDEPLSTRQIVDSAHFQEALRRDQLWNCVEETSGQLGAYRHLTINEPLGYEECACARQPPGAAAAAAGPPLPAAYVNVATRGDLSSFAWFEAPLKYLEAGAVGAGELVRVAYAALNFRDVMLATGRLPLDSLPRSLAMSDCLLGLEFAGVDSAGRRVMCMVGGRGIATHVHCAPEVSVKLEVPEGLSLAEAATIPVCYATAIMALMSRGRMRAGESVLVHAGSGGVGQAAIRLALHFGLEVFTTVGSDEKRAFLLREFAGQLKEANIFSSRSCHFEHQVAWATRGRGVDLVLNSLADDKLQASVNCLADGGRFLEIGKYDLSVDSRLELLKLDTNKTFHGILLDKLFDRDEMSEQFKQQLRSIVAILRRGLAEGFVRPIKRRVFERHQVEEAFRFMATGKHIGKVLLRIDQQLERQRPAGFERPLGLVRSVPRFQPSPHKCFIVTGGLGGFGLELCKWLVGQGARWLVVTSRTGVRTGYQRAVLRRLESRDGARLLVVTQAEADASTAEGALELCRRARAWSSSKQLGGIFHLAMVLRDALLNQLTAQHFDQVFRPKAAACAALDEASQLVAKEQAGELDYFVAFSSITSGKGNAGQANYAYANSCLERVCERRRARRLHALAVQWGAIGDVGAAFDNLGGNDVVVGGTVPQRLPSCFATLAKLLGSPFAVCLSLLPAGRQSGGAGERGDLVGAIMHVLGIKDASKVSEEANLGELGLDSLMAVEIRQYIEREYDMTLNIQEIRALTIARIRAIGDSERPAAARALPAADQRPQAASYGQRASAAVGAPHSGQADAGAHDKLGTESKPLQRPHRKRSRAAAPHLDKNLVSSFVPALELPELQFEALNEWRPTLHSSASQRRPIFFLPPIHGHFEQLRAVCAHIERPCVALNWTHELAAADSMQAAVAIYLRRLETLDWSQFELSADERVRAKYAGKRADSHGRQAPALKRVDLVGYSFGATVAYELMRAIQRRPAATDSTPPVANRLRPGRLVLLDGSPRHTRLGARYLSNLTRGQRLKLAQKADELLMVYVVANTRCSRATGLEAAVHQAEYLAIGRELAALEEVGVKVALASERLLDLLLAQRRAAGHLAAGSAVAFLERQRTRRAQIATIERAMETYLRRYQLVSSYKPPSGAHKLKLDSVTLVRADKLFLRGATGGGGGSGVTQSRAAQSGGAVNNSSSERDDLGLARVLEGRVELHVLPGDHESFLSENTAQIGALIEGACRSLAPPAHQAAMTPPPPPSSSPVDRTAPSGSASGSGSPSGSPDSLLEGGEAELAA